MKPFLCDSLFRYIQKRFFKGAPANSFEETQKKVDVIGINNVRVKNENKYSDKYPNSFFDVFYAEAPNGKTLPTFVNLHGGGFFMGSRVYGDPLVNMEKLGGNIVFELASLANVNVVLPDYCLAPQYRYPNQIHQINEFFKFLVEHGEEYALDTKNIILMGDSAGATLAAIYGAIISNSEYAKEMNITPAISTDRIKGIIIDAAPMDISLMNRATKAMYKTWIGATQVDDTKAARQIHIPEWVTKDYPPTFLTAGNDGCFPEDMKQMYEALKAKGCDTQLFLIDPEKAKEPHGYLNNYKNDPYAKEGIEKIIAFTHKVVNA